MAKAFLSDGKIVSAEDAVRFETGDLVLLKSRSPARKFNRHNSSRTVKASEVGHLRVFNKLDYNRIIIDHPYILRKSDQFGRITIPLIDRVKEDSKSYSNFGRPDDLYVGQEDILEAVRNWPGFEVHAEWISRLKRPYITD